MDKTDEEPRGLDLTPMIDVTFLLLIFFMVATKFKTEEGRLDSYLPDDFGPGIAAAPEVHELRLILRKQGVACALSVNRKPYGLLPNPSAMLALEADLRRARADTTQDRLPIVIDAGEDVPVAQVVATLNSCIAAGLQEVTYARRDQLER